MALILHLETATRACSVGLSSEGTLLAIKEVADESFVHGEQLTLFIQEVMTKAGRSLKELDAVSVSAGPGSYTGLRIGAATAKGLCYALEIPLIAIDSLHALAALVRELHPDHSLCPMIDARRMEVYTCMFNSDGKEIIPVDAVVVDVNTFRAQDPFLYFGDGAEKLAELWQNRSAVLLPDVHASAKGQCKLAYQSYQTGNFVDLAYWEPRYLKEFVSGK